MAINEVELAKDLSDHKHRIGSLEHRMDSAEKVIDEIHDIATSVKLLAQESRSTGEKVDTLTAKVEAMEAKPSENMEKIKSAAITSGVTLIVTALIGAIARLIIVGGV